MAFPILTPESEVERAFVQAGKWDADLIWRRSMQYRASQQWNICAGYTLCLAYHYATGNNIDNQARTVDSVSGLLEQLSQSEKCGLFRAVHFVVVCTLKLPQKTTDCTDILLFVQLMLEIVAESQDAGIARIDMFRRLGLIYKRTVAPAELEALRQSCSQRLAGIRNVVPEEGVSSLSVPPPVSRERKPSAALSLVPPKTIDQRRLHLEQHLQSVKEEFGINSTEVCTALVKLIDFHIEQKEHVSVFRFLDELTALCGEQSVKLNTYQVRAVYAVSSQVSDQAGFLALVEELERAVFLRRARLVGFDVTSAGALMRLAFLWHASGRLELGTKFCANVLNQANEKLPDGDFTRQYFQSIHDAVGKSCREKTLLPIFLFNRYDHSNEFIASQAVLALHHVHCRREDQSFLFLNELLNYYSDCIGDAARRAGEMIWMLAATELASHDKFVAALIRSSCAKATDSFLVRRLDDHLKGMVETHGVCENTIRSLRLAVECRSWSAISGDSDCVELMELLSKCLESRGDSHELHAIRKRIEKARAQPDSYAPGNSLARSNYFIGRYMSAMYALVSEQMRQIKLVEILLSKGSLAEAETAWHAAVQLCKSDAVSSDLKVITKDLIDRLIEKNMFEKAASIAQDPRLRRLDCSFYKARLASACIKHGDLFTGAAILLEAFADVDDAVST